MAIYEARTAALALIDTPCVMNRNLDNRLAVTAAQLMLGSIMACESAIVGGDWHIRFDRSHLDDKFLVEDLPLTQFLPDWTPNEMSRLRLGVGLGERGSLGPTTLWNKQALGQRYPTYFGNGDPARSIGDGILGT